MKSKTLVLVEILLALVIVGLGILLYACIIGPVHFNEDYEQRRDACAERLGQIRTLEEAYKNCYGCYTGSFDTLFNRLLREDSLKVVNKKINKDKIPADVDIEEISEAEAVKLGYKVLVVEYVNPIDNLYAQSKDGEKDKFPFSRADSSEIRKLCFLPYPKGTDKKFQLQAGFLENKGGYKLPVFECLVMMEDLLSDLNEQRVLNKIAELKQNKRFPGWKVGDMTQATTVGNFE